MRWVNFQQTMVPGEESIVRQTQVSIVGSSDQKRVVLTESEHTAFVRTRQDFEIDLHYDSRPSRYLLISKSSKATSIASLVYRPASPRL